MCPLRGRYPKNFDINYTGRKLLFRPVFFFIRVKIFSNFIINLKFTIDNAAHICYTIIDKKPYQERLLA